MKTTILAIILLSALNLSWYYYFEQEQNKAINHVYNEHLRLVKALTQPAVKPTPQGK